MPGTHLLTLSISIWPIATFTLLDFILLQNKLIYYKIFNVLDLPFWVIIELIPTKLLHYPLPVLPAIAILAIGGLLQFKSNIKKIKMFYFEKLPISLQFYLALEELF